jgi:protein-S-isoprenylcysteine O-methyltransferase Ste14
MKIFEMLFRFRRWALVLIFAAGFWAPFDRMGGAHPGTTWLFLAGMLARYRILPIAYSSIAVMGAAILLALLAALLRTWASAYLGPGVVRDRNLHGERVVADGPYRYVRNPLYVGLWLHTLALAILMPPGGAIFAVVAVGILIVALVHAEEHHLSAGHPLSGGEAYAAYMRRVPRFLPALQPRVPPGGERAHWGSGFLGEIYMWGAVLTYAAFASRYNATILEQGILISLGISVVVQGILRPARVLAS